MSDDIKNAVYKEPILKYQYSNIQDSKWKYSKTIACTTNQKKARVTILYKLYIMYIVIVIYIQYI